MDDKRYYLSLVKDIYNSAKRCICERLACINFNRKLFSVEEEVMENGEPSFAVSYDGNVYLRIMPYRKNYRILDGSICYRGHITIKRKNDAAWYSEGYKAITVYVNEYQEWEVNHHEYETEDFFKHFIPLGDEQEIEVIKKDLTGLGVSSKYVLFDTMNQRYVLNIDFTDYLNPPKNEDNKELFLCKYMSLDTFLCIVKSKKIRLNSVVSMNDSSESFFLGDYLCDAYDDVRRKNTDFEFYQAYPNALRYKKIIERKNRLIMSLTNRIDDAMMWRLYGDNGRGMCLCFQVPSHLAKPIIYLSDRDEKLRSLKNVVSKWQEKNIHVTFDGMEEYMFLTKSVQFEYEKEFRILKVCEDDKLQITKYGNLISFYNDYEFQDLGIQPSSLYVGSNLPNWDVNYPLLVDMAKRYLGIATINNSKVDKLRV